MKKPFVIGMLALLACGGLTIFFVWRHNAAPSSLIVTEKDMAEAVKKLGRGVPPPQIAAAPLDLKRPVRLAIGSLGFVDANQNRRISDLVLTELSGAQGLNLVERQALDAALREISMSLSGLVRAKDAVRVGKLLKADWFLLGTEAKFGGTNFVVVRVVDARTGILRDAGIFSGEKSPVQLSSDIAAFVRKSRQMAAIAKPRTYLAIGTFQDLSVNNRQAAFPAQLRSYLTAAYQGTETTLLEREAVDTLLQEVRLDLAGLTESGGTNAAQPMRSAYWLVDGSYQSYETTNFQVELAMEITRMFGRREQQSFRGAPGSSLFQQVKSAIDSQMINSATALWPTRNSEAHVQMLTGKELANLGMVGASIVTYFEDVDEATRRNTVEAIRAFKTVLLLEPTNREAKMYLSACLHKTGVQGINEGRDYYREVIEEGVQDKWTGLAKQALVSSFRWSSAQEKSVWFASALQQHTNSAAAKFYEEQAQASAEDVVIAKTDGPQAEQAAEKRLYETIRLNCGYLRQWGLSDNQLGIGDYVKLFGTNHEAAAERLVELLPKMKSQTPEMEPYLLATVLTFQTKTNSPVISEFEKSLDEWTQHPDRILKPGQLWEKMSWSVYDWCFERTNYALAVKLMEGEQFAAGKEVVEFDDQEKIKLAYAYMSVERWQDALNIFESFSGKSVRATGGGPWGDAFQPILTDKLAARCREKLGMKVARDPREFDISTNLVCMHTPSVFTADADGLWLAIAGKLIRLDFDLRTNLVAELPISPWVPITCIAVGSEKIWTGTQGDGLVEFDKASRRSRQITVADGLMMNDLSSLHLEGDSLWIGYGNERRGGLGVMDLRSHKIKSYMSSLAPLQANEAEVPPSSTVQNILADRNNDLWVLVAVEGLQRLNIGKDVWQSPPDRGGGWTKCFTLNDRLLVECVSVVDYQNEIGLVSKVNGVWPKDPAPTQTKTLFLSDAELTRLHSELKTNTNQRIYKQSGRTLPPKAVLHAHSFANDHWQSLENAEAAPHPATAMALEGRNLWLGGEGFISLLDLNQNKMLKTCHLQIRSVERIQIAGGYVWAQFDWHLHRALLTDLR